MDFDVPFDIHFEDPHILVVSKPSGLLTQAVDQDDQRHSFDRVIQAYLDKDSNTGQQSYLGTVHRLDQVVSGVMVWAKTERAARRLSKQFEARRVSKVYWAVVEGSPSEPQGVWEDWIGADQNVFGRKAVGIERPEAKFARTRFETLGEANPRGFSGPSTFLQFMPETGRTHQLRVQSSARDLPILGDFRYDSKFSLEQGIALHARSIRIQHPQSLEFAAFVAEPPLLWMELGLFPPEQTRQKTVVA